MAVGTAAEHLVCCDLILKGVTAYLTSQNCAYDVVADLDGKLVRIQVKATRSVLKVPQQKHCRYTYQFNVRRAGKGGKRLYRENSFDLLALVALDIRQVAYLPPSGLLMTVRIRPDVETGPPSKYAGRRNGKRFADHQWANALKELSDNGKL